MEATKTRIEKLGIDVSLLGFGCMRFPTIDGKIDEVLAEKMLDEAYSKGINYYDTAFPYHNGDSEPFVGRVMSKYDRVSYYLATKLPTWNVSNMDDAKRIFELQRSRIDGNYIDFYLIHALNRGSWTKMRDLGVVEYLKEQKAEGKIKYLGFSFHDDYEVFEEIIDYTDWDFCQIQLNYMDTVEQAGMKGYKLAESKDIPLVIMEPVKGGLLANLPDAVTKPFKDVNPDASYASWALRWVASLPNVKVVLSGMSDLKQVSDNLETFCDFKEMTEEENAAVKEVGDALKKRVNNGCTGCRYCMPCPKNVDIPGTFSAYNKRFSDGWFTALKEYYMCTALRKDYTGAANCIQCGKCEQHCPQGIEIRKELKNAKKKLEGPAYLIAKKFGKLFMKY